MSDNKHTRTMTGRLKFFGRNILSLLAIFLLVSAAIKLGGIGTAIAKGETPLTLGTEAEGQNHPACTTDEDTARVLAALQKRESLIATKEKAIAERLVALETVDKNISQKLSELEKAEKALSATMALARTAASDDLSRLTSLYENMKPKQAVPLFEAMDPEFAAGFLAQMKPSSGAQIMAGLNPEIAYTISVILAGRNSGAPTR